MMLNLRENADSQTVVFVVRVQPRAARNQIAGVHDGAIKIRIHAPAIENRANEELCFFLASLLKRPKSAVRLLSGERGRNKRIEISGVTAAEILALVQHEA